MTNSTSPFVVRSSTLSTRNLSLQGAPKLEQAGELLEATGVQFTWGDAQPTPTTVKVFARKIKKDGKLGASSYVLEYTLGAPVGIIRTPAPVWIQELVAESL